MKYFRHIDFKDRDLSELVLNHILEDFVAGGGSELAIYCVNFENSVIAFKTDSSLDVFNVLDIVRTMRSQGIESIELNTENHTLSGFSGDGGKEWVFAITINSERINGVLESLWYSTFEQ